MPDSKRHPAVGIDLGTTFSAVAYLDAQGRPETIRNAEGDLTTPSAIFFDHKQPIVGVEAIEAGLLEPDRLALYAKRDVGEARYGKSILGGELPPEVLQALVLRKLKQDTELVLGDIEKAVVTVPAFFNEPCRKATQDAGRIAGLEVMDIINEPTAAAITFGVQSGFLNAEGVSERTEKVLVYDLGGGTFDVTVMEIDGCSYNTVATAGDVYLGGIDWDRRLVDFIADAFKSEHGVDPREDPCGEQELLRKANQAKHALTQRESFSIAFAHEGMRLRTEISQSAFSDICADLVERTLMTVGMVLDDSKMKWSDLTRLILVGGSTRMPMIRAELEKHSGMKLDRSLSPDEAVCHGAALYAGMLLGQSGGGSQRANVSVSNVNSHDLGVLAVHPRTGEPARQVMIPRNTTLPARQRMVFRTHSDNQANVKINVIEGGDDRGVGSTEIGRCMVNELPKGTPKGTEVQVQFDYAQDGRLTVSASLPAVEREMEMTLDRAAGLDPDEIAQWIEQIQSGKLCDTAMSMKAEPEALVAEPIPVADAPVAQPTLGVAPLPLPTGSPFETPTDLASAPADKLPLLSVDDVDVLPVADDIPMADGIPVITQANIAPVTGKPIAKAKPITKPTPKVQAKPVIPVATPTAKPAGIIPVAKQPQATPAIQPIAKKKPNTGQPATPAAKPVPVAKPAGFAPIPKTPKAKLASAPVPVANPAPRVKSTPKAKPVAKPKPAAKAKPIAKTKSIGNPPSAAPVANPGKPVKKPIAKPHMKDFPVTPKVADRPQDANAPQKPIKPVAKKPVPKAPQANPAKPQSSKPTSKPGPKINLGDHASVAKLDASEVPDFTGLGQSKPKQKSSFPSIVVNSDSGKKSKKAKRKKGNDGDSE